MNDDAFRQAECVGKVAFRSKYAAKKAARRRPGRCAYRCSYCGQYHVGEVSSWRRTEGRKPKPPPPEIPKDL